MQAPTDLAFAAIYARIIMRCNQLIIDGRGLCDTAFGLFKDSMDGCKTNRTEFEEAWPGFVTCSDSIASNTQKVCYILGNGNTFDPRVVVMCSTTIETELENTIKAINEETSRMLSGLKKRTAQEPTGPSGNSGQTLSDKVVKY